MTEKACTHLIYDHVFLNSGPEKTGKRSYYTVNGGTKDHMSKESMT